MRLFRLPMSRVLRSLALGMLAVAIMVKPVLAEFCNAHALSHLVAERAADAANGDDAAHAGDSAAEALSDRDHASGKHQSLHASDTTPGYVEPFPALGVPPARFTRLALPGYVPGAPPSLRPALPLRPPIA